ncbi:hydrolase [Vibrio albus]|uniref:Hydrolase n=1 Tax=Vibrio albus TaxID=2200953 RepID=A0A2U3BD98_9VIBR|nr:NlpC/P60 family protein [Vibrio albus]PWI34714.1 hydrolase [Vibrio albus]
MNLNALKVCTFIILSYLGGCSSLPEQQLSIDNNVSDLAQLKSKRAVKSFIEQYNKWKGTPYSFGGTEKSGIDCSAFVQVVFSEAQRMTLPRTTKAQSKLGYSISLDNIKSGDLVFFKTSYKQRHVGIYIDNQLFMHASTSKGVTISRLDNPYWASVFWQARRLH